MATSTVDDLDRVTERLPEEQNRTTITGGRELTYAEYGDPDGTPVVFLHGTPGSRQLAGLFDSHAGEFGVRLLAPDRPGFGESEPWRGRSVRDGGEVVTAVLDDAGVDSAGIVAFSGGSPYALATAATVPDRVDRVDLVAGATPAAVSEETPSIQRVLARLATTTPTLLGGLFRWQSWMAGRLDPSFVVDQYTADDGPDGIPDSTAEAVKRDFLEAFARHRTGAVTEFRHTADDWGIDYGDVDVPVTLWHGKDDTNVPLADARRHADEIPTAELEVIEDADHLRSLLEGTPDALENYR
jgi:pimeloyl-ACP methyl ester carboxylesterase